MRHPDDWLPVMVICESCGRIGTTYATDWDGETVAYECRADLVEWATGCGHSGRVSPFGGRAKLPWNLHWVAKWRLFGVTIEAAGKDLTTAGGSRERSEALAREVFGVEPPPDRAVRVRPHRRAEDEVLRSAPARRPMPPRACFHQSSCASSCFDTGPQATIEFDPDGTDAIPRLFDEFDRVAAATAGREVKGELPPDHERVFALSLVDPDADVAAEAAAYRPAFAHLALLEQIPGVDVPARVEAEKGSSLTAARAGAARGATRGRSGVAGGLRAGARAPRRGTRRTCPRPRRRSTPASAATSETSPLPSRRRAGTASRIQAAIFATAAGHDLPPGRAFAALYLAFLGRTSGPRAGWLLAALDREFVLSRLREASAPAAVQA